MAIEKCQVQNEHHRGTFAGSERALIFAECEGNQSEHARIFAERQEEQPERSVDLSLKEKTIHGTALLPAAAYNDDITVEEVPWHWHEEFETGYICEGQVRMKCGTESYLLSPGDVFFINTSVLHYMCSARLGRPTSLQSIVYHPSLVGGDSRSVYYQKYVMPILKADSFRCFVFRSQEAQGLDAQGYETQDREPGYRETEGWRVSDQAGQSLASGSQTRQSLASGSQAGQSLASGSQAGQTLTSASGAGQADGASAHVRAAFDALAFEKDGYELAVREELSQLHRIILETMKEHEGGSAESRLAAETDLRQEKRARQMLEYIHAHFREELSLMEIASEAAVSESEALRCFRTVIGVPPVRYLKTYRLQRAAHLIRTTDGSVVDIAGECGFSDNSYFAREFRKQYSCTPTEYRKQWS